MLVLVFHRSYGKRGMTALFGEALYLIDINAVRLLWMA